MVETIRYAIVSIPIGFSIELRLKVDRGRDRPPDVSIPIGFSIELRRGHKSFCVGPGCSFNPYRVFH